MNDRGVGSWIERRARFAPDRPALWWRGTALTYGALAGRVRRLAAAMQRLGVDRGDRVAWLGPNHPAFLETLFATAKIGAVLSPINHRLDEAGIQAIVRDASPTIAVVEGSVRHLALPASVRHRVVTGDATSGSDLELEALIADTRDEPIDETVSLDDLCMLPFTSGTTGAPKGVMLTHGNVTWNVVNLLSVADVRDDDVTIAIAPFFRVGGTGVNILPVLFKGGSVVVPDTSEPAGILGAMERSRVTIGFGNPDLLDALMRDPSWTATDLSSLRFILTGGAPVPERLIEAYVARGVPLLQGYGLSEAAPVVLVLDRDIARRKVGAAGRPPLFVDVEIVEADGRPCAPDRTGELLVRGPNVMAGYWNAPDATARAVDGAGWLHTGDAARVDADGDVWIVGRVNEAFSSSDGVVHPGDVERVLLLHPDVADAAVVGVGEEGRQVPAALVVLEPGSETTEDELLDHTRLHLSQHQLPPSVTFVAALPRTSVGKLQRDELPRLLRT